MHAAPQAASGETLISSACLRPTKGISDAGNDRATALDRRSAGDWPNPGGVESATSLAVRTGADYLVLDIYITPQQQWIRVLSDDGGGPGMWPIEMFEVRSPLIPSNWRVAIEHYDGGWALHLAPEPWLRPGFWMDYFDRAREGAGDEFDDALAAMAIEEGLHPDGRILGGIWRRPE